MRGVRRGFAGVALWPRFDAGARLRLGLGHRRNADTDEHRKTTDPDSFLLSKSPALRDAVTLLAQLKGNRNLADFLFCIFAKVLIHNQLAIVNFVIDRRRLRIS